MLTELFVKSQESNVMNFYKFAHQLQMCSKLAKRFIKRKVWIYQMNWQMSETWAYIIISGYDSQYWSFSMDVFNNAPNNKKGGKHQTFQYQDISFRTLRCFLLFIYTLHLAFSVDVDQKKSNFLQNKSSRPWGCFPWIYVSCLEKCLY